MPKRVAGKSFPISMLDWWANAAVTSCRLFGQRLDPCAEIPGRERRLVVSPRGERAFPFCWEDPAPAPSHGSHGRQAMDVKPWTSRSPTAAIAPIGRRRTRKRSAGQFSERPFHKRPKQSFERRPIRPRALLEPRLRPNPTLVGYRGGICGAVSLAACPRTVRMEPRQ
jgi:hypothetical protein